MKRCAVLVLALATALSLGNATAEAAKKHKAHTVHGTIVDVQKANGVTTLTVKVRPHHKKGAAAKAPVEKTYQVAKAIPVEKVSGPKGNEVRHPAKLGDLHAGDHVAIVVQKDVAEKVTIRVKGKKNKA